MWTQIPRLPPHLLSPLLLSVSILCSPIGFHIHFQYHQHSHCIACTNHSEYVFSGWWYMLLSLCHLDPHFSYMFLQRCVYHCSKEGEVWLTMYSSLVGRLISLYKSTSVCNSVASISNPILFGSSNIFKSTIKFLEKLTVVRSVSIAENIQILLN